MTYEELEAIRSQFESLTAYLAAHGVMMPDFHALLAYIDELHSIVHDLRQDATGEEWGKRAGVRAVMDVLEALCREFHRAADIQATAGYPAAADAYRCATQKVTAAVDAIVRCAPDAAPHLAPDDLRRENEALRQTIADLCCPVPRSSKEPDHDA